MNSDPLLAVIDTQIWVDIYLGRAIRNPTQPYLAIFDAFIDNEFVPVYSRATFEELKRILTTSRDVAQYYQLNAVDATDFVEAIFYGAGEFVQITSTLHVSTDVDDDMFVEAAIVACADVLVSRDKDLHEPAVRELLKKNQVRVLYPHQFRKMLETRRAGAMATEDPL